MVVHHHQKIKKKKKKRNKKNSKKDQKRDKNGLTDDDWTRIHNIITRDLIHEISDEEKDI